MPDHTLTQSDHDTLIEIKTIQEMMLQEIKELKEGTALRLTALENNKADKDYVMRMAGKIGFLERAYWIAIGALAIIQILVTYYVSK